MFNSWVLCRFSFCKILGGVKVFEDVCLLRVCIFLEVFLVFWKKYLESFLIEFSIVSMMGGEIVE